MKKILLAVALALGAFLPSHADAQTVVRQPFFAATNSWVDVGNGPTELLAVEGSAVGYTALNSAIGSVAAGTAVTLTTTPSPAPCVGCFVSCPSPVACTIPAATTVVSFTPPFALVISASSTITAATINFGVACPTSGIPPAPNAAGSPLGAPLNLRAAVGSTGAGLATPVYSTARICVYGGQQQGGTLVNFPIGAW